MLTSFSLILKYLHHFNAQLGLPVNIQTKEVKKKNSPFTNYFNVHISTECKSKMNNTVYATISKISVKF